MVISVASVALVVDLTRRTVACALGSVATTPRRCTEAEAMVMGEIDWDVGRVDDPRVYETFGAMCAAAASPIDDHRSTADYRRHGIGVMARRALMRAKCWAWSTLTRSSCNNPPSLTDSQTLLSRSSENEVGTRVRPSAWLRYPGVRQLKSK